jgi:hypothetical protein
MTDHPAAGSPDDEPVRPDVDHEQLWVDEAAPEADALGDDVELTDHVAVPERVGAAAFPTLRARMGGWARRTNRRFADDPGSMFEAFVSFVAVGLATALVIQVLHPSQWLSNTTATGGDMGSHVWGPRYLVDHLLPHWRLSGWTPDWYDGFPAYQFYMVIPSLIVVIVYVGLPFYLWIPALFGCVALACLGWAKERLYPYRHVVLGIAVFLAVLVVPLSYNRSFKLVTALGLIGLPVACWAFAKLADLPFPVPPLAAVAALIFIFNRQPVNNNTGNIIGGNFQSTMAGEFAFSISLTLAVLYLGVAVRGLRTGRHRALAAVLFAAAGLCHLIPAFFVLGCTAALFVLHPDRKRLQWLATMVPVAGLLTAFWVVPFALRSDYVNNMGWEKLPVPNGDESSASYYLWPKAYFWLLVFAIVGIVVSIIRKRIVGMVLGLVWGGMSLAFVALPEARLWNARLLPFIYLSISLLGAIALGELIHLAATAAAGDARRPLRVVSVIAGSLGVLGVLIYVVLPLDGIQIGGTQSLPFGAHLTFEPIKHKSVFDKASNTTLDQKSIGIFKTTASNPAPGWSNYDYRGLEKMAEAPVGCDKPGSVTPCTTGGWKEYRTVVRTMAGLGQDPRFGCGRAMWEYDNNRLSGYGTPMALMMLPYWTDGCIGSQEGLYFESSATVPYHFYMQAELSTAGSNPERDLVYPAFDIDAGVRHMQLLGVKYYMASTTQAIDAASRQHDLTEVALAGPWHIYEVAQSQTVTALQYQPVVADGMGKSQDGWLPTAGAWFLDQASLDVPMTDSGPSAWKHVQAEPVPKEWRRLAIWVRGQLGFGGAIDPVPKLPRVKLPKNQVSKVHMGRDTISFDVSRPGVPVLVKASYFPNWQASGADGPFRVTPNLMVVIPHSKHVELHYGRTPIDLLGIGLTVLGIVAVLVLVRLRPVDVPPDREGRISRWLDEVITIPPTPTRAERGRRRRTDQPLDADGDGGLDDAVAVDGTLVHEPTGDGRDHVAGSAAGPEAVGGQGGEVVAEEAAPEPIEHPPSPDDET